MIELDKNCLAILKEIVDQNKQIIKCLCNPYYVVEKDGNDG